MTEAPWRIDADHPAFAGHFPGRPIVPGVVLLDFALREVARSLDSPVTGWRIASAKFLAPVGPGSTLVCRLARAGKAFDFEVRAGEHLVATGRVEALH
jgi:3-hydroxyacyl-[acyl-carrier-protein] dehydratase